MLAPISRSKRCSSPIGRRNKPASPVMVDAPTRSAATALRNRDVVPARPASITTASRLARPMARRTCTVSPPTSISAPSCCNPATMRLVSSPLATPVRRLSPGASAAHTNARLLTDFEPGTRTTPCSGAVTGANDSLDTTQPTRATAGLNPRAIRPPRNSSALAASTTMMSTPRSPSTE